jgi:hypothetical protein
MVREACRALAFEFVEHQEWVNFHAISYASANAGANSLALLSCEDDLLNSTRGHSGARYCEECSARRCPVRLQPQRSVRKEPHGDRAGEDQGAIAHGARSGTWRRYARGRVQVSAEQTFRAQHA